MERRTGEKFKIDSTMPEVVKPAWLAVRDFFKTIRAKQRECSDTYKTIMGNRDLNEEARDRLCAENAATLQQAVDAAREEFAKKRDEALAAIDESVERALGKDPFAPLPIDFTKIPEDQRELARATSAQAEQTARVARLLVEQKVDQAIDRALAQDKDRSGAALLRLCDAATKNSDALFLHALAQHGLRRIELEGSTAQRTVFADSISRSRESRLPEVGKLLLDHKDALSETTMMVEAARGDTRSPRFLAEGFAPGLNAATQYLGDELAGGGA